MARKGAQPRRAHVWSSSCRRGDPLRAGRDRRQLEAGARPRPPGRHPDHADRQGQPVRGEPRRRPRQIIDERVNGSGVAEAEVTTQGNQFIVVEIPGKNRRDLVDTVQRQAQLRFRTVACSSLDPGPCGSVGGQGQGQVQNPLADLSPSDGASPDTGTGNGENAGKNKNTTKDKGENGAGKNRPGVHRRPAEPSPTPTARPAAQPSDRTRATRPARRPTAPRGRRRRDATGPARSMMKPAAGVDRRATTRTPARPPRPSVDDPDKPLVTCGVGEDADAKYLLSPAAIEGTDLDDAIGRHPAGQRAAGRSTSHRRRGQAGLQPTSRAPWSAPSSSSRSCSTATWSSPPDDSTAASPTATPRSPATSPRPSAKSLATSLKFGALPIAFSRTTRASEDDRPVARRQPAPGRPHRRPRSACCS